MVSSSPKNELTQTLRTLIMTKVQEANETDRAEASLCSLSFQSKVDSTKQVWIEVDENEIQLELEDWQNSTEWDHTVAQITVKSFTEAIDMIKRWFSEGRFDSSSYPNQDYVVSN